MDDFDQFLEYQEKMAKITLEAIKEFRIKRHAVKRTYSLDIVENILRITNQPLHISEIIEMAKLNYNITLNRDSLSSAISKKVTQGQRFVRTAPNTFFLKN